MVLNDSKPFQLSRAGTSECPGNRQVGTAGGGPTPSKSAGPLPRPPLSFSRWPSTLPTGQALFFTELFPTQCEISFLLDPLSSLPPSTLPFLMMSPIQGITILLAWLGAPRSTSQICSASHCSVYAWWSGTNKYLLKEWRNEWIQGCSSGREANKHELQESVWPQVLARLMSVAQLIVNIRPSLYFSYYV